MTPEHFDRTFNINACGAYFTVRKALPLLNDGASIILTGSVVGQKGMPIYSTYAAAKAALRSYVRSVALICQLMVAWSLFDIKEVP